MLHLLKSAAIEFLENINLHPGLFKYLHSWEIYYFLKQAYMTIQMLKNWKKNGYLKYGKLKSNKNEQK